MISGKVNPDREAVISLTVRSPGGQEQEIEGIIDTGFNGSLTLPSSLIATLALPWLTQGRAQLADGREEVFDVYAGTVLWDGQPIRVMVDAAETTPLIGMELMYGYKLDLPILDGATLTLERI